MALQNINLIPQNQNTLIDAIHGEQYAALANLGQRIGAKGDSIIVHSISVSSLFSDSANESQICTIDQSSTGTLQVKYFNGTETVTNEIQATDLLYRPLNELYNEILDYVGTDAAGNSNLCNLNISGKYIFRFLLNSNNPSIVYGSEKPIMVYMSSSENVPQNDSYIYAKVNNISDRTLQFDYIVNTNKDSVEQDLPVIKINYVFPYVDSDNYWVINDNPTSVYASGKDAGRQSIIILHTEYTTSKPKVIEDPEDPGTQTDSRLAAPSTTVRPIENINNISNNHIINGLSQTVQNAVLHNMAQTELPTERPFTIVYDSFDILGAVKNSFEEYYATIALNNFSGTQQTVTTKAYEIAFAFPGKVWLSELTSEKQEQLSHSLIINVLNVESDAITTFWEYDKTTQEFKSIKDKDYSLTLDNLISINGYIQTIIDTFRLDIEPYRSQFKSLAFTKKNTKIKNYVGADNEPLKKNVGFTLTVSDYNYIGKQGNSLTILPTISEYTHANSDNEVEPTYWWPAYTKYINFDKEDLKYDYKTRDLVDINIPELDLGAVITSHPNVLNSISFLQGGFYVPKKIIKDGEEKDNSTNEYGIPEEYYSYTYSLHIGNTGKAGIFSIKGSPYAYNISTERLSENNKGAYLKPMNRVEFSDLHGVFYKTPIVKHDIIGKYHIDNITDYKYLSEYIHHVTLPMIYIDSAFTKTGDTKNYKVESDIYAVAVQFDTDTNNVSVTLNYNELEHKLLVCAYTDITDTNFITSGGTKYYIPNYSNYDIYLNLTEMIYRLREMNQIGGDFLTSNSIEIRGKNVKTVSNSGKKIALLKLQQLDLLNTSNTHIEGNDVIVYIGNQISLDIMWGSVVVNEIITNTTSWNKGVFANYKLQLNAGTQLTPQIIPFTQQSFITTHSVSADGISESVGVIHTSTLNKDLEVNNDLEIIQ